MNHTAASPAPGPDTPATTTAPPATAQTRAARAPNPVLLQLAQWYPALFGERPLPLKLGIFQDLMDAHAPALESAALRTALTQHTRSMRYLNAIASGAQRHDLQGRPVQDVAPEHVLHALLTIHRRRKPRPDETPQLLRDKMLRRIAQAFIHSGLPRSVWLERAQVRDPSLLALVHDALQEADAQDARAEALHSAWLAAGRPHIRPFAAMYGLHPRAAQTQLQRAKQLQRMQKPADATAPDAATAATAASPADGAPPSA